MHRATGLLACVTGAAFIITLAAPLVGSPGIALGQDASPEPISPTHSDRAQVGIEHVLHGASATVPTTNWYEEFFLAAPSPMDEATHQLFREAYDYWSYRYVKLTREYGGALKVPEEEHTELYRGVAIGMLEKARQRQQQGDETAAALFMSLTRGAYRKSLHHSGLDPEDYRAEFEEYLHREHPCQRGLQLPPLDYEDIVECMIQARQAQDDGDDEAAQDYAELANEVFRQGEEASGLAPGEYMMGFHSYVTGHPDKSMLSSEPRPDVPYCVGPTKHDGDFCPEVGVDDCVGEYGGTLIDVPWETCPRVPCEYTGTC